MIAVTCELCGEMAVEYSPERGECEYCKPNGERSYS